MILKMQKDNAPITSQHDQIKLYRADNPNLEMVNPTGS
jgi:hypothetical protein